MAKFALGFGRGTMELSVPDERIAEVIEGKPYPEITDIRASVIEVLRNPIGTPPLQELVTKGDKVAVVASDVTRAWIRHDLFLPVILDELNAAGVPDEDILLVAALGAHRKHTDAENVAVYGQEVVNRVKIVQSHAPEAENYEYVGTTTRGNKTYLNKHVLHADKVILTGGIVFHLMAGFGGGRKSVLPGIAGYETIQANHSLCLHDEVGKGTSPACCSGKTEGNNMHEDMMEIAEMLNPTFIFNIVLTAEGKFARFVAGHWRKAWESGCETVAEIFGVPIKQKADVVVASAGGFPKDINLYQGSKTIDNADMACKDNGVVIMMMECPDIAEPPDFSGWFNYESLYGREIALRKAFTVPGFIALKAGICFAEKPHILITLPQNKAFIEKAGMIFAENLDQALAIAEEKLGRKDFTVTVMSHGANTVPMLK
jgi:nickel-dependent lactate racemase